MFTVNHFIWIAICIAFIASLTFVSLKMKFSLQTASIIMACIAFLSEITKIFMNMEYVDADNISEGMVIDPGALPLHLCSFLIFVFVFLPFCKNEKLKSFLLSFSVPISLIGATLAIIMATNGVSFAKFGPYQCFFYHAAMIWFAIYLIATKNVDLGIKAYLKNAVTLLIMVICMLWVNGALKAYDTNFFYVVRPPVEGLPLLNLDNGWYAYFATIVVCGIVGLTAVHLPAIIKEIKSKK